MGEEETKRDRLTELTDAAERLVEGVNALNREAGGQLTSLAVTAKRNRQMIWGLVVSISLDLLLTAFVIFLADKVNDTQEVTRAEVLCPLYQQFINADTPAARERAKQAGQDLKAREEAYKVIREAYAVLNCKTP